MSLTMVFSLLGGLGLFIFGMQQMGVGLQKAAGNKLRHFLEILTTKPFMGVLVGAGVTSIIQSSTATTVMVVGFVNAGLMTLAQSIGVIMGANIGTTITGQLVAFKLGDYAFHAITLGAFASLFAKRQKIQYLGQILLGFGILFLGLNTMSNTMRPLRDSAVFIDVMARFGIYPILGVLMGMLITIVLQSSTATFGILLGLVSVGAINYQAGLAILLGSNIGTTITAILSGIGANRNAKKAAVAHFIFNVLGATIVIILIYIIPGFTDKVHSLLKGFSSFFGQAATEERLLANTHTVFNVVNMLVWLPFVGLLEKIVNKVIVGEDVIIKRGLKFLDERMLKTPSMAIDQLKNEVIRVFDLAIGMVKESAKAFMESDLEAAKSVERKEEIINELEEELVKFLTKFPRGSLAEDDVKTIDMYYAMIDDIESIGDDAHSIAELARYKEENKLIFSDEAKKTLEDNFKFIDDLLKDTFTMVKEENIDFVDRILSGEKDMDQLQLKHRNGHMERLGNGICDPNAGIVYLEVLDDLEHISDQMADMAHSLIEAQ